ncbi:MAG: class I SAM-dependent methyltransferase [Actinomycetota bacterium]|jgi:SAM-dependent methyltransferase|nr:class I SAM-dependent methyltransferase [Actinomycetota bacterium]MDA8168029.1 class I SAM-dependent methyltransferase [Actinomycetota bacterium]
MNYILGDNETAAKRLKLVADLFAPSTESFLNDTALPQSDLVLDLACGPGHTTRLLAKVLNGTETIGIDQSVNFIAEAEDASSSDGLSFICHDITDTPFPVGPADIIFTRYILLHLENPSGTVNKWLTQLKPGGFLLLEELEQIDTDETLFQKYLELLERSLELQNKRMFIGPLVSTLSFADAEPTSNRIKEASISAKDAAAMFFMNMQTLKNSEYVRALYNNEEIEDFVVNLEQVMEVKETSLKPVSWKLRQIAIRKEKKK